jgi:hypothetical protein
MILILRIYTHTHTQVTSQRSKSLVEVEGYLNMNKYNIHVYMRVCYV